jgi:hypothetical protein
MDPASDPTNAEPEEIVAQWDEPVLPHTAIASNLPLVIGVSALLVVLFALAGYFLNYGTLYLAAFVPLAAGFMLVAQVKRPTPPRAVMLTTQRLQVGTRNYGLDSLAGFWLDAESGLTVINMEPSKPSAFPISLLHPSADQDSIRDQLLQVLPELESRTHSVNDSLNRYIKL